MNIDEDYTLIRWPQVETITGVQQQTAYVWMKQGKFPRPVKQGGNGPRSVAFWRKSDVIDYVKRLLEDRGPSYQTAPLETHGRINRKKRCAQSAEAEVAA
jgi:predicted DNA-binding transcriptional regulator AlpA